MDWDDIKVGEQYRVIDVRDSWFGNCRDIIRIIGKVVTVYKIEESDNVIRIRSEMGTHCVEPINLAWYSKNKRI